VAFADMWLGSVHHVGIQKQKEKCSLVVDVIVASVTATGEIRESRYIKNVDYGPSIKYSEKKYVVNCLILNVEKASKDIDLSDGEYFEVTFWDPFNHKRARGKGGSWRNPPPNKEDILKFFFLDKEGIKRVKPELFTVWFGTVPDL